MSPPSSIMSKGNPSMTLTRLHSLVIWEGWTLHNQSSEKFKRMGLSFTTAAGPRQRIHSQVRAVEDSWRHFTVSDSRLPQPGVQVPVFISPRNRVAQLYSPALGSLSVAFCDSQGYGGCYSNPPPHPWGAVCYTLVHKLEADRIRDIAIAARSAEWYSIGADTQRTRLPPSLLLLRDVIADVFCSSVACVGGECSPMWTQNLACWSIFWDITGCSSVNHIPDDSLHSHLRTNPRYCVTVLRLFTPNWKRQGNGKTTEQWGDKYFSLFTKY
jgi:hypothetical protein